MERESMEDVLRRSGWIKSCKGEKMVLEEHGVSTVGKTGAGEWMRRTLGQHSEFRDEKSMI